jgi:hypothetical protein
MGYHGTHKNSKTGEVLAQNVQVCNMCFRNFASDRAWEKHYDRKKYPNGCMEPKFVGLKEYRNTFGAIIFR